jgi:hypothetical protein
MTGLMPLYDWINASKIQALNRDWVKMSIHLKHHHEPISKIPNVSTIRVQMFNAGMRKQTQINTRWAMNDLTDPIIYTNLTLD